MRLTQWTDYTLRVLMYCAACKDREKPVTITEIADAHRISRSHLTKIVFMLGGEGLLETSRGRGGGIRLRKSAQSIGLGSVVRLTETDFDLVECFDREHNTCGMDGQCRLKGILYRARQNFLAELDQYTLQDLIQPGPDAATTRELTVLIGMPRDVRPRARKPATAR